MLMKKNKFREILSNVSNLSGSSGNVVVGARGKCEREIWRNIELEFIVSEHFRTKCHQPVEETSEPHSIHAISCRPDHITVQHR